MLLLSLSFTSIILVGARMSFTTVFLVLNTGDAVLDRPMLRMNLVWRLAPRALIDMILAFFHTQEICGTLYLFLFFHPHPICLPLNVGCTGTTEVLNSLLFC